MDAAVELCGDSSNGVQGDVLGPDVDDPQPRWVVVVRDVEPLFLHSEMFRVLAKQGGMFKEG